MTVFLFIVLIIAVLFGKEIRELIGLGIVVGISYILWEAAWWGKIIAVIIIFGALYNLLEPVYLNIRGWFSNENQKKDIDN